jgi:integrase/recombinase XerD
MRLEEAIEEFLLSVESDGRRPGTITWYKRILKPFRNTFQGKPLDEISTPMIRQFLVGLRRRTSRYTSGEGTRPTILGGLSEETISAHRRVLRRFWSWSVIEYGLSRNPMANIKPAPHIRPDPKGVSLDDVRAIFQVTGQNVYGARDRAILMFLLDTGCRAQGICTLRYDNLELDQKRAILGEKGRSNRAVFLSDLTIDFLKAWLELRPVNAITVFCSVQPPRTGNPLTYDGLKEIMRRLKKRAHVGDG